MTKELSEQDRIALENHMNALNARQTEAVVASGEKPLPEQDLVLLEAAMAKPKAKVRISADALDARAKARAAASKEERLHDRQMLRQRFIKSEIERHSVLPAIPSAQDAQRDGQRQGIFDAFLVASGLVKLSIDGVPDDLNPQERIAWQLVPAFLNEYGHRYPHMTPKMLVAAWSKVMTTQTASGQLMVDPTELRLVVEHMAKETGEQFNPKMMAAHALRFRIEIQNGQRKAPTMEYPGRFFDFHSSVTETPPFVPTVWVARAEFPALFPASTIDEQTLDLINSVVHYRYMTERTQGFTSPMAGFLAEVLLTAVIFRLNADKPLTPSQIFHTAYRFSHRYMAEQRPHESKHAKDEPTSAIYSPQDEQGNE